jgi:hypothetical protein
VVLVGPRPPQDLTRTIAEIARVLPVGSPAEGADEPLRDALAVLLPLDIAPDKTDLDELAAWETKRKSLGSDHPVELAPLLTAANRGEAAVTEALRLLLEAPFEHADADAEEA